MQIASISIKNFRSISDAKKLELQNLTVLVGPNNEGKSNIIRALSCGMRVLIHGRVANSPGSTQSYRFVNKGIYEWASDYPQQLQDANPNGETIITIWFQLDEHENQQFYTEIGSRLNGELPIEIRLGQNKDVKVKVVKRGPGSKPLNKKTTAIARFITKRVSYSYIPAVRPASGARSVIHDLVATELEALEQSEEYLRLSQALLELQRPVLERVAQSVEQTLGLFVPNLQKFEILCSDKKNTRLGREILLNVDDGCLTSLDHKGDGVQSLVALALLKHVSDSRASDRSLITVIEEPEAHLHPSAIHRVREVIYELATTQQVILTTHNPVLVCRDNPRKNVIVQGSSGRQAKTIAEVREVLGARVSDNLQHAELVVVVEGETDKRILESILSKRLRKIKSSIENGRIVFDSMRGGRNLVHKLSILQSCLVNYVVFLDHDTAILQQWNHALENQICSPLDGFFASFEGKRESELEDWIAPSLYASRVQQEFGVDILGNKRFKGKGKWSDRIRETFILSSRACEDSVLKKIKFVVAECVESTEDDSLLPNCTEKPTPLVERLERL